jgi:D-3-phosphoglycerate dehydrogenase / 2-oxoglutarate reductase
VNERPKVLLTDQIHPAVRPLLDAHCAVVVAPDAAPATIARLITDVDALIVRNKLAPDVFDHAPRLRVVVRHGVGLDLIPVPAATARGIPVANLPGSNTTAVAEYCLAAMLQLRRGLAGLDSRLRRDGWAAARPLADAGRELRGSVLGIVGVGAIGARVAEIGAALGMRVLGLTRRPDGLPAGITAADKATLFAEADVVVLSCPLNEATRGLLDAATLATMKPDAIVINVSRGPVIDTAALLAALRAGRLGGAALDVHDRQPLTADEAVFDAPNLLLTPHVAGVTATSLHAMSQGAVDTTLALLRGERPANVVNPEVFR